MRQEKAELLLRLAMKMQSYSGVTLKEISAGFDVSHRTAQHYRDAVERLFPQIEKIPTDTQEYAWKIPPGALHKLIGVSADEISALEAAISEFDRVNLHSEANRLSMLKDKILASLQSPHRSRVESDIEVFTDNQIIARKPGPIASLPEEEYSILRRAMLENCELEFEYVGVDSKRTKNTKTRTIHPYGLLLGHRHYLLAVEPSDDPQQIKKFAFPRIKKAKLTSRPFKKNPLIMDTGFVDDSFGIFMEDDAPYEIEWRFSAKAASHARDYQFHHSQKHLHNEDGSLTVTFKAGGLLEMAWHLCMWGKEVEVIMPIELKNMIDLSIISWPALP